MPERLSFRKHTDRCASRWTLAPIALALLWAAPAAADPPPGYYASVDAANSATLRTTLHAVIDDHLRVPYTSEDPDTWDVLELADQDPDDPGEILDLYRNASYPKAGGGNAFYNREHVWPNSYGFPDDAAGNYPYTDGHALFLADSGYNSSRGNNPYRSCDAACTEKVTEPNHGRGGGSGVYPGNSNWRSGSGPAGTWETWVGRRGDVARALFYLDVRYEGGAHGVTGHAEPNLHLTDDGALIATTGSNASSAFMGILAVLRQWHAQDPIDESERRRNDVVFGFQGNRNPFIDHPEWVECLYGNLCAAGGGDVLSLHDGRFRVTVRWETQGGASGSGHAVPLTDESGYFWFFDRDNVEVVLKVLDACGQQRPRFWFFAAGLTNVRTVITVEDTRAAEVRTYENPQGTPFQPLQDANAFDTCDAGQGEAPTAAFDWSYRRRLYADFIDLSFDPDGTVVGRQWDFGDGETATAANPSHRYSSAGLYPVQLVVTDDEGMTASAAETIEVCTPSWGCCRVCTTGRACGDSCIASDRSCHQPIGCACDDWELCP